MLISLYNLWKASSYSHRSNEHWRRDSSFTHQPILGPVPLQTVSQEQQSAVLHSTMILNHTARIHCEPNEKRFTANAITNQSRVQIISHESAEKTWADSEMSFERPGGKHSSRVLPGFNFRKSDIKKSSISHNGIAKGGGTSCVLVFARF